MCSLSNISFRVLCRRQMLVNNCISSHCLSTTIPPSNKNTKSNVGGGSSNKKHRNGVLPDKVNSPRCDMPPLSMSQRIVDDMARVKLQPDTERDLNSWTKNSFESLVPTDVKTTRDILDAYKKVENSSYDHSQTAEDIVGDGPDPEYNFTRSIDGFQTYASVEPFPLKYGSTLQGIHIAYETWGKLNEEKNNAVLVSCGLSAASHARSNEDNTKPGWWERFIGPGCALDTDKYFVICMNNLGGCHGTTGPSSEDASTGKPYGTTFPTISIEDMVRAQFKLLDSMGIYKIYSSIGSSLGGMLSIMSSIIFPERVNKVVSISASVSSHPTTIAMRYLQRKAIMSDPSWRNGHYYDHSFPKNGMKLAREIATLTYRSGPEWEQRFNRKRIERRYIDQSERELIDLEKPTLDPSFLVESYLNHQGEAACTKLDPNTLLYISKAMDLYDLGESFGDLHSAMVRVKVPVLIIGVQTDLLFPVWQQRQMATSLQEAGNDTVTYYELNSIYGHDTFLLDLNGVGAGIKGFLETKPTETGHASCK